MINNLKYVELSNGYCIPNLCYGTGEMGGYYSEPDKVYKRLRLLKALVKNNKKFVREQKVIKSIKHYIKYSDTLLFDTSRAYGGSEKVLSETLKKEKRENYYIVTKLQNKDQFDGISAHNALKKSMFELGVEYVDLYLIHWPVEGKWIDYWIQLEELYNKGLCKAIGVCNCKIHHLEELKKYASIIPMVNEIECHPLLVENELRDYCKANHIQVMAYTSSAQHDFRLCRSRRLNSVCKKYNRSLEQVILRWHIQIGNIPIFNTSSIKHLISNCNIYDFQLDESDLNLISSLNINARTRYDSDNCEFDIL